MAYVVSDSSHSWRFSPVKNMAVGLPKAARMAHSDPVSISKNAAASSDITHVLVAIDSALICSGPLMSPESANNTVIEMSALRHCSA